MYLTLDWTAFFFPPFLFFSESHQKLSVYKKNLNILFIAFFLSGAEKQQLAAYVAADNGNTSTNVQSENVVNVGTDDGSNGGDQSDSEEEDLEAALKVCFCLVFFSC